MPILVDSLDTPINSDQQLDTPLHQPPRAGLYQPDPLDHPPHGLDGDETLSNEVSPRRLADNRGQVDSESDVAEDVVSFLNPLEGGLAIKVEVMRRRDEGRIGLRKERLSRRGDGEWGEGRGHHGR